MVVGYISPEAAVGGAIALVAEGDQITIDAQKQLLHLHLDDVELQRRKANWKAPEQKAKTGVLAKYARVVSSSSVGAVTD
jgi:dihydroxy-acid dehydratase